MEPEITLAIRNLHVSYDSIHALKGVDLLVNKGEFVAILGPNGAGKSTLMKAIIGTLTARSGDILLYGRELAAFSPAERIRLGLGIIPEGRQLFTDMTVRENLILGAYSELGVMVPKSIDPLLDWVFDIFPRLRERQRQSAGTLSGGEAQMLAIARALMTKPRVLLCDEPSIGLSPMFVREALQTLTRLHQEGTTIILSDQNAVAALRAANRGYILDTGRIVASGSAEQLLKDQALLTTYLGA